MQSIISFNVATLLTTLLKSGALRISGSQYLLICSALGPHILPPVTKHFTKAGKYHNLFCKQ